MHALKLGVVKNISGYSFYVMNLSNYFKNTLELKKRKKYYVLNSIQFIQGCSGSSVVEC